MVARESDDLLPAGEPIECEGHGRCDECGTPMCEHDDGPLSCPASALLVPDWTL